jgi:hypothetical protein
MSHGMKDAHMQIPVFHLHKYIQFCIKEKRLQFRMMPFAIAIAPTLFRKVLTAVTWGL